MEIDDIINQKVVEFQQKLIDKSDVEKKLFHYNSVLNISKRIVLYQDEKANLLKEKLLYYFDELDEINYTIDNRIESLSLQKLIEPIVEYLIKKEQFCTNGDLHILIVIGLVIDIGLYYFISPYYYPLFILLFFIWGLYRRRKAKKEGKYAAMFW